MEKHQRSTSNESLLIVSVSSCGEDKIQHTEKEKWSQQVNQFFISFYECREDFFSFNPVHLTWLKPYMMR